MPTDIYEAAWIFIIYAFLGWISEVAFAAVEKGTFVNRGFLNGPVCPIYGVGMLAVVLVLWQLRNNILLLFLGSALLTTALEWLTGFVLEKFFHDKWWDYSDMPFNLNGYVCLKFTILWGLAAAFVVGAIHPLIVFLITKTPRTAGIILLIFFFTLFSVDFLVTLAALFKLPKKLRAMRELEKSLRILSDKIGGTVSETTLAAAEKGSELLEQRKPRLESLKAEYEKKFSEYKQIVESKNIVHIRIFKAFPKLKGRYEARPEWLRRFTGRQTEGENHDPYNL